MNGKVIGTKFGPKRSTEVNGDEKLHDVPSSLTPSSFIQVIDVLLTALTKGMQSEGDKFIANS